MNNLANRSTLNINVLQSQLLSHLMQNSDKNID